MTLRFENLDKADVSTEEFREESKESCKRFVRMFLVEHVRNLRAYGTEADLHRYAEGCVDFFYPEMEQEDRNTATDYIESVLPDIFNELVHEKDDMYAKIRLKNMPVEAMIDESEHYLYDAKYGHIAQLVVLVSDILAEILQNPTLSAGQRGLHIEELTELVRLNIRIKHHTAYLDHRTTIEKDLRTIIELILKTGRFQSCGISI